MDIKKIDYSICKFNLALLFRAMLLLSPVLLLFYQENGLEIKDLLFFQGVFYLTSILAEAPTGYLSDIISKRNMLISSLGIYVSVVIFWLFFHGFYVILIGEILTAISKVFLDNAMPGYLYEYLKSKDNNSKMVKYYGYLNFYLALGTAIAAILGTYLYKTYTSTTVLLVEIVVISTGIFLLSSLPNIKTTREDNDFKKHVYLFSSVTKDILKNKSIKYHILYSGLLTSLSIIFSTSFQPFMQRSLFPIFMFGVIAFFNHGTRAVSSAIAGKFLREFDIHKLIVPLYILYLLAFIGIFIILSISNKIIITTIIVLICLVIGLQLIFTILHISRLQRFIASDHRGNLMFVNNLISRSCAAIMLMSSKLVTLEIFYILAFVIFILLYTFIMIKTYQVKEKA